LLAELDVPDIEQELQRNRAELKLAEAQVKQKAAAIQTALAAADVAASMVVFADAEVGRTVAAKSFREKQYNRMKDLSGLKAIDERLVDEKQDEHEAAVSAQQAAMAKVLTAKSEVVASKAKVEEARADLEEANSRVAVAQAMVQKSEVQLAYSRIVSPYDGVVTDRAFHIGDFVQSADDGNRKPILQVQKVDVMRLIVQMPDRDVAYTDVGDRAEFKVDALGSEIRKGTVSRYANSEDERTRSMRTEIDLKNPDGKLRDGMYGQVVLYLQDANPNAVHIPSACLVGRTKGGGAKVFVCADGKLRLTPIKTGYDNGVVVEVTDGLNATSKVVFAPGGDLVEGTTVEPVLKASSEH
jgi:RND family efflux transporter MFP subunit